MSMIATRRRSKSWGCAAIMHPVPVLLVAIILHTCVGVPPTTTKHSGPEETLSGMTFHPPTAGYRIEISEDILLLVVLANHLGYLIKHDRGDIRLPFTLVALSILLGSTVMPIVLLGYDCLKHVTIPPVHPPTTYPLSTVTNQLHLVQGRHQPSSSTSRRAGTILGKRASERNGDDRDPKQPRRGRDYRYHPEMPKCKPCALWEQSGSDANLLHLHPQDMRHAGDEAHEIESYASWGGTTFHLVRDSCICRPCMTDYRRNYSNRENTEPRWAKRKREYYESNRNKHCLFCCDESDGHCPCLQVTQWGPDQWSGLDEQRTWKHFLCVTGRTDPSVADKAHHVCRTHYRRITEIRQNRTCQICSSKYSDSPWKLVVDVNTNPEAMCSAFSLPAGSVNLLGWICRRCELCTNDMQRLCTQLQEDIASDDIITATRASVLQNMVEELRTEGVMFTRDIHADFKERLKKSGVNPEARLTNSFTKYIITVAKKHSFHSYSPPESTLQTGKVIYNAKVFNPTSIAFVFKLRIEAWKAKSELESLKASFSSCVTSQKLRILIKEQVAKLPKSGTFDYRTLSDGGSAINESTMDAYFNAELVDFLDEVTTSDHSLSHRNEMSLRYRDVRKIRIKMIIALLCVSMNPAACFIQTLLGLMCYANGLRDRGFEVLNAFGCTCSAEHIREHGTFWADKRNALDELDRNRPWRGSIDNLNFNIKFAKSLQSASSGAKKMLNLITGQVSTRSSEQPHIHLHHTLANLVHQTLSKFSCSLSTHPVSERSFIIDMSGERDPYFTLFTSACFVATVKRRQIAPEECAATFMESLRNYLPHWTPPSADTVVYTTIQEAMSASIGDIETYLLKLKQDLKIGCIGYPKDIVVAGDQQTYALMRQLKGKHPQLFNWIVVIPGDWHLLKLTSEVLRDLTWDGGLKQLCYECGYKKQPTQWQEIHMLLVAMYESLLRKSIAVYASTSRNEHAHTLQHHGRPFWKWVTLVASPENSNQVSCFWASVLLQLNSYLGYYFAIRSGNWHLRNSCLKAILPLFFAYNRNKYEELGTTALHDTYTFPTHIQELFVAGQWTISQQGKPYHNLALDEAHESIINLRIKTITARPSHFRTVELADFLSYLEKVVYSLKAFLNRYRPSPSEYKKRYTCQRTTRMVSLLQNHPLFDMSEGAVQLTNIFDSAPAKLDTSCIHDLLHFTAVGTERLITYVQQYILPTIDSNCRPKKRKRERKLCTFSSRPAPAREQKCRVNELENIARNAMQILQDHGITEQTSPYPQALADIHGNMRASNKSTFLAAVQSHTHFLPMFKNSCSLLTQPRSHNDISVIVDLLYYIHIPPSPDIFSFYDFFHSLWTQIVHKFAYRYHCKYIYVVIDKPEYLVNF